MLRLGTDPLSLFEQMVFWILVGGAILAVLVIALWLWAEVGQADRNWTEIEAELTERERQAGIRR